MVKLKGKENVNNFRSIFFGLIFLGVGGGGLGLRRGLNLNICKHASFYGMLCIT